MIFQSDNRQMSFDVRSTSFECYEIVGSLENVFYDTELHSLSAQSVTIDSLIFVAERQQRAEKVTN